MLQKEKDAAGTEFLTDDAVGFAQGSLLDLLVNQVNFDCLYQKAEALHKKIFQIGPNQLPKIDCKDADIVIANFTLGGKALFIQNSEKNADILTDLEALSDYPCLDDQLLAQYEKRKMADLWKDGTVIDYLLENMTEQEKAILDKVVFAEYDYETLQSCPLCETVEQTPDLPLTTASLLHFLTKDLVTLQDIDCGEFSSELHTAFADSLHILENWADTTSLQKNAPAC